MIQTTATLDSEFEILNILDAKFILVTLFIQFQDIMEDIFFHFNNILLVF